MTKLEKEQTNAKTGIFMKRVLIFSFSFVVAYTVWTQVALVIFSIVPDSMVTEKVYQFFGLEICVLMFKKMFSGFINDLGKKLGWANKKEDSEEES